MTLTWKDIRTTSAAERDTLQQRDRARMESGEMTFEEASERLGAWNDYVAHEQAELQLWKKIEQLARATRCPKHKAIIPWLIARGLLVDRQGRMPLPTRGVELDDGSEVVEELDRYALTDKANRLRAVGGHAA